MNPDDRLFTKIVMLEGELQRANMEIARLEMELTYSNGRVMRLEEGVADAVEAWEIERSRAKSLEEKLDKGFNAQDHKN